MTRPKQKNIPADAILDPNLIDYLRHIHGHKKKFIQFSFKKIEQIINTELKLDLSKCTEITRRVIVQSFAHFLKAWPEWSAYSNRLIPHVEGYISLKSYLKRKLLQTKLKEKAFGIAFKYNKTELPDHSIPKLPNNLNIELPYNLTISAPPQLLPELKFTQTNEGDMEIEFKLHALSPPKVTTKSFFDYPFASREFHLPGIIKIKRACCSTFERYITKANVPVHNIACDTVVENVSPSAKIYTFNLLRTFFMELLSTLEKIDSGVLTNYRAEISGFSNSLLTDIFDSDLCNKTVCEGAKVTFNAGHSTYFSENEISQPITTPENKLVYRKIFVHCVSYSLEFCSIKQKDVRRDGLACFDFRRQKNKVAEENFLKMITSSITYECVYCKQKFDTVSYKLHLVTQHSLDSTMTCAKCCKVFQVPALLRSRWRHTCT